MAARDMVGNGGRVNSLVAAATGTALVLVGLLGFAVARGHGVAGHVGGRLGLFELNTLHNMVHVGLGAALVASAIVGLDAARRANVGVGGALVALGVLGVFIAGDNPVNVIALNGPDNALHLLFGAGLVAVARRPR
jgi:hypothetical protein